MRDGPTHSSQLENLSSEILKNSGDVDSGFGTNAHLVLGVVLQETLDTTAGELEVEELACANTRSTRCVVLGAGGALRPFRQYLKGFNARIKVPALLTSASRARFR
jgi:hypothetical protein